MKTVHPYLNFSGNTEEAFNFYKKVFGKEFESIVRFKDMPMDGMELPEEDLDKIMHIGLPLTNEIYLMGTDALESCGQKLNPGNNMYICISPENKDEAFQLHKALSEGGKVGMEMAEQPWGALYGDCTDKFGVQWMINFELPK